MARRGNSVFGIDLGKHIFKGVLLQRKGDDRFVLTSYASREVPEELSTPDDLAHQLKGLLKDLGGSANGCAIAVSDPESLLRIIEQPVTPIDLLRNALRLNGLMVLNQECKDFILDCAPLSPETANGRDKRQQRGSKEAPAPTSNRHAKTKYLGGRNVAPDGKTDLRSVQPSRVFPPTFCNSRRSARSTLSSSPIRKLLPRKRSSSWIWDTCKAR